MVAENDQHGFVEQSRLDERLLEVFQGLVEEAHGMQVVAKRRAIQRAKFQDLVPVGKIVEWVVQRQSDEPCRERPRQGGQLRNHLREEISIVQSPADLFGEAKIGFEQTVLKAIRRVHHTAIPEPRLEGHRRQRRVSTLAEHMRKPDIVVCGI